MHRYFLKSLVGFFLVAVSSRMVTGHSLSFLRALANEAEVAQQESLEETNIDPANGLGHSNSERPAKTSKPKVKNFVNVQLEGSLQGHTITQGDAYELMCTVDGSPEPKIHWVRGSNPSKEMAELFKKSVPSELSGTDEGSLVRVKSKYVIDCASQKDEGPIHCIAIAGQQTSIQSTTITVKENSNGTRPCKSNRNPVISYYTSAIFATMGSTVILPCKAEGTPRPLTRWVDLFGAKLGSHQHNSRYKILGNGDLLIDEIEWSDMGGPTCIAESSSGVDRTETFLYPMKPEE